MNKKRQNKLNILFLCTGNSCRSQMAEGFARALKSDSFNAWSAGIEKHGLNPNAVSVMAESGIDITVQHSSLIEELPIKHFDYVITLCGHANEHCPPFTVETKQIHVGFDDPPTLAKEASNDEQALAIYRRVRDEIKVFIEGLPDNLAVS